MLKIQKGHETVSKTFRMPKHLVQELDKLAYKNEISLNNLVTQCLNFALQEINSEDADELDD